MYSCRTSKVYKLLLIRTLHRKKSIFFQIWKWKSNVAKRFAQWQNNAYIKGPE